MRAAGVTAGGMMLSACREPSKIALAPAAAASAMPGKPAGSAVASGSSLPAQTIHLDVVRSGPSALPNARREFAKQYPGIALVPVTGFPTPPRSPWIYCFSAQSMGPMGYRYTPLDAALRQMNFDPGGLISGSLAPYVQKGQTIGLPFTEIPWAVQWSTTAFAAAGLKEPSSDWTIADFRDACAALKRLGASGHLRGLVGALAPLVTGTAPGSAAGALTRPGLWQAFAWGYGGKLVRDGRYTLTDAGTTEGIATLVDLAKQYAVAQRAGDSTSVGLAFALYHPGALPAGWRWARLPRFPVDPVITTVSIAQGLVGPGGTPGARVVSAATEYLLWWYSTSGTALLIAQATPPALASHETQSQYWRSQSSDAAGIGDYKNFRDCYSGLPTVPDQIAYLMVKQIWAGRAGLSEALVAAQQNMNDPRYVLPTLAITQPGFRGPDSLG